MSATKREMDMVYKKMIKREEIMKNTMYGTMEFIE